MRVLVFDLKSEQKQEVIICKATLHFVFSCVRTYLYHIASYLIPIQLLFDLLGQL